MFRTCALLLVASCGGGGGGISPEDPLADLDEDGVGEFCQDLIGTYESFDAGAACTFFIVAATLNQPDALTPQECQLASLYCQNQFNQMLDPEQCQTNIGDSLSGCDATVGELESCVAFVVDATSTLFGSVSCSDIGDQAALENLSQDFEAVAATFPADCTAVQGCVSALLPFSF